MEREEKINLLKEKSSYTLDNLVMIMELLRSEGGCPWDREQTHESIRNDFIEETYEVIEAIDTKNPALLREELGVVLLKIFFHSRIEEEEKRFDINDVIDGVCVKLIHRHPHVFGDVKVKDSAQVLSNWEIIKSSEKSRATVTDKLRAIPPMLPALMRAQKVGKKAKCFDFKDANEVMDKLYEESAEVKAALEENNPERLEEEIGDLLLAVTSLCRKTGTDAEAALQKATEKFICRFESVEQKVTCLGKNIDEVPMQELDAVWNEIKKEKTRNN